MRQSYALIVFVKATCDKCVIKNTLNVIDRYPQSVLESTRKIYETTQYDAD